MKAGYKAALEPKADIDWQQPCQQSTACPHNAGRVQGYTQQPRLEAPLHAHVPSCSASAQGHLQQPLQMNAPLRSSAPQLQQQGSLPQQASLWQQPQQQGSSLQQRHHQGSTRLQQPCQQPAAAVTKPSAAKGPALLQSNVHQQLVDDEVCCAQPLLPSVQPQQQHGAKDTDNSQAQVQTPHAVTGQPADRASSSGQVGLKAEGSKSSSQGNRHAGPGELQQANAVGHVAHGATRPPQSIGQGLQAKASERSTAPDKENAETGKGLSAYSSKHQRSSLLLPGACSQNTKLVNWTL